ncbi:MAG: LysR family transcriptional regulator [Undibacterium sp.]|nr:LysR family transcriptional regulator [Undibacterium sp.]
MHTTNAITQYKISAADLEVVLALGRFSTLSAAGERLGLDGSTIFRTIQRIEKGLGQRLFQRSRLGFLPMELALELINYAENIEAQIELARVTAQADSGQVTGLVRITTTDTILNGLVAPSLKQLQQLHPLLTYDLHTDNALANLTRREADIAIRATKRPPPHLIGKSIGPIRVALFSAKRGGLKKFDAEKIANEHWIAPDDALPEHPSVIWRKQHFPKIAPRYRVNSIMMVSEMVAQGLGIGLLPLFLAQQRKDLHQLTAPIEECETELWLLTHTESRHLRRVSAVFSYLSESLQLA